MVIHLKIKKDQSGQVLVEFALIAPIFIGLIFVLIITGLWIYNSSQTSQAARIAAHYMAVTGDMAEARDKATVHLQKTMVAAEIGQVSVCQAGDMAQSVVVTRMETFIPGLKKLFNPGDGGWTGKVTITKEAQTVREYRFRNPGAFNRR